MRKIDVRGFKPLDKADTRGVGPAPQLGPADLTRLPQVNANAPARTNALTGETLWRNFDNDVGPRLDWIVAGGESGPGARPMHPDWARSLRDQCAAAGVPFHFKQWGNWVPHRPKAGGDLGGDVRAGRVTIVHPSGRDAVEISQATGGRSTEAGSIYMADIGKARAGRLLDGVEHNGLPEARA
jgi:hypothetical protein